MDAVYIIRGMSKIKIDNLSLYEPIQFLLTLLEQPIAQTQVLQHFDAGTQQSISQLLPLLIQHNIIQSHTTIPVKEDNHHHPEAVFYWHFQKNQQDIQQKLASINLALIGVNDFSVKLLHLLQHSGFTNAVLLQEPSLDYAIHPSLSLHADASASNLADQIDNKTYDCWIAIACFNQRTMLSNYNMKALQSNTHFVPVLINNLTAYIGPHVISTAGPCFDCSSLRYYSNHEYLEAMELEQHAQAIENPNLIHGYHHCMVDVVASFVCMELINYFSQIQPVMFDKITELSLVKPQVNTAKIIRAPNCPACGKG